ncbi:MAG TPA: non-heme iron oxygenase ferredoxin subunit [Acidimicrobiia bacterium]
MHASGFRRVAAVDEIRPGRSLRCSVDGRAVLVCNVGGEFYAIADVCTHDHGPLGEGRLQGYAVECPRHGARFDVRDGRVMAPPAVKPIETYAVRVNDGDVEVELP